MFKALKHEYEHHMEEEHVFKRAREVIGEEQDPSFGQRFLDRRKEELGLVEEKQSDSLEDCVLPRS